MARSGNNIQELQAICLNVVIVKAKRGRIRHSGTNAGWVKVGKSQRSLLVKTGYQLLCHRNLDTQAHVPAPPILWPCSVTRTERAKKRLSRRVVYLEVHPILDMPALKTRRLNSQEVLFSVMHQALGTAVNMLRRAHGVQHKSEPQQPRAFTATSEKYAPMRRPYFDTLNGGIPG
ncbi:hypothetical protein OIDMADRAFT_31203 [Oidiodendron maius Zn]|uniref:Uncharacterized protein n=1 Tax=Oidiodendron maius (strain Zn) TaxID=913774 RepID=A0A0C3H4V6_OIDMZ|nr:hypothetical protein OIDMADRAFT_31203 [Oidiodendron maius Zn]